AGDEDHVLGRRQLHGRGDRRATVRLDQEATLAALGLCRAHAAPAGLLQTRGHLGDDGLRILAARVVRGHHRHVGELTGHLTHQAALALVALAAATETHEDPTTGARTRRLQRTPERVVGVRVVHQHRRGPRLDPLHPARDAGDPLDAVLHVAAREAGAQRHACGAHDVLEVVRAEQLALHRHVAGRGLERRLDAVQRVLHVGRADLAGALAAELPGHALLAAQLVVDAHRLRVVAVDDRDAATREVVGE